MCEVEEMSPEDTQALTMSYLNDADSQITWAQDIMLHSQEAGRW